MIKSPLFGLTAAITFVLSGCASDIDKFTTSPQEHASEICLAHNVANRHDLKTNDTATVGVDDSVFKKEAPRRYVVKKGDTLWDISRRFLAKPWHWRKIWHANPHIKNPHWIYPGDVLEIVNIDGQSRIMMTDPASGYHGTATGKHTKDGRPIVKYQPHTRAYAPNTDIWSAAVQYDAAYGAKTAVKPIDISADILQAHMLKTEVVKPSIIADLPFVFGTGIEYLTLTQEQEIFAKRLENAKEGDKFNIYRPSVALYDDENVNSDGKPIALGQEMIYVGEVVVKAQNPARDLTVLRINEAAEAIKEGYVLMPAKNIDPSEYQPTIPNHQCARGYFIRTAETPKVIKEFDNVFVSFGRDNGAQVGDIWKVVRRGQQRVVNGQNLVTADKDIGFVMIYRVEDKFSHAFVLEASQNISYNDSLVRPE